MFFVLFALLFHELGIPRKKKETPEEAKRREKELAVVDKLFQDSEDSEKELVIILYTSFVYFISLYEHVLPGKPPGKFLLF